ELAGPVARLAGRRYETAGRIVEADVAGAAVRDGDPAVVEAHDARHPVQLVLGVSLHHADVDHRFVGESPGFALSPQRGRVLDDGDPRAVADDGAGTGALSRAARGGPDRQQHRGDPTRKSTITHDLSP